MCDLENKEKIFLAKIQLLMNTFEEIDEIVENNPNDQQSVDYEISDYLHLLQNEDLSDESMLEISKKLKNARIKRSQLQNTAQLIKAYTDNKSKLAYQNNRYCMENAIKNVVNRLNQDYNYRVLDTNDILEIKNEKPLVVTKEKHKITKEELEEMINRGMKTKEIALALNCCDSNISHLKKLYGLGTRNYTKRGE